MARVKICGINSISAMDAACAAGADWIGFVFAPGSPRTVSPDAAELLSARHPGGPLRVGLFVDPDEDEIEAALEAVPLDVLQIHAETERVAELRGLFGVATWRAVQIARARDLPRGMEALDGYVLDAAGPAAGGNGIGFDHALLAGWQAPHPWLLAGGLAPDNVADAIRATGAAAVDVSSGVERVRGLKDPSLIAAFVTAARQA